MSKTYKAMLFDYDGTIIDTNQLIIDSWDHMYNKHFGGHLTGEDVKWTFGMILWDAIDQEMKSRGHSGYDLDELVESYREYQRKPDTTPAPPFEGVREVLFELKKRGVKLGIVTSRAEQSCVAGLKKNGIYELFDCLVTAETTDIHKPRPEPALYCLKGLGAKAEESLMIGDSVFDLQCGNAAGCDSAFVTWSFATTRQKALDLGDPTYIIDRPEQLLHFAKE